MTGPKTNELPGTRAVLRHFGMSASKARLVLNLIRGEDVATAREILTSTPREAAAVIGKLLGSAVANAGHNEGLAPEELYVASAYADEGPTMKRFAPRAKGRSTRIRKRTTHVTIVVARMDDERIARSRAARSTQQAAARTNRVLSSRRRADQQASFHRREEAHEVAAEAAAAEAEQAELDAAEALEAEGALSDEGVGVVNLGDETDETGEISASDENAEAAPDVSDVADATDEGTADEATEESD